MARYWISTPVLAAYLVIPLMARPFWFQMRQVSPESLSDSLGIILIYWIFGFCAITVLGTPLLICYLKLGWTGYLAYAAGGSICAWITAYLFEPRGHNGSMAAFFSVWGVICVVTLRMILFGFRSAESSASFKKRESSPKMRVGRVTVTGLLILATLGFIFGFYGFSDCGRIQPGPPLLQVIRIFR